MQTLLQLQANIDYFAEFGITLSEVNGLVSYNSKYLDYSICILKAEYLNRLVWYLSKEELQTLAVAKDTFITLKMDFYEYPQRVEVSQILSKIIHSKLMMVVRWLLLDNPFNP